MKGENLQKRIVGWLKALDIYCHRFYDAKSTGFIGNPQPADYWCYYNGRLTLLECKEVKSSLRLSFNSVRPSQYKSAMQSEHFGYVHLLIIQINNEIYLLETINLIDFINKNKDKSSIHYNDIKELGFKLFDKNDLKSSL